MNHPMIEYWNEAFVDYKKAEHSFYCKEMPDPILSPNFIDFPLDKRIVSAPYFNTIMPYEQEKPPQHSGYHLRNDFYLCRLKVKSYPLNFEVSISPIAEAVTSRSHQDMLLDGFPKDFEFLRNLEVFLNTLNATYQVGAVVDGLTNKVMATLTMGVAGRNAVLISGMVHSDYRGQRLSRRLESLSHFMAREQGAEEMFYWTKSRRLLGYADHIDRYLIYIRK